MALYFIVIIISLFSYCVKSMDYADKIIESAITKGKRTGQFRIIWNNNSTKVVPVDGFLAYDQPNNSIKYFGNIVKAKRKRSPQVLEVNDVQLFSNK